MKRTALFTFLFSILVLSSQAQADLSWAKKVGARTTPTSKKVVWVNDFGSTADSNAVITNIIQKAIDACAKSGGGIVAFKAGTYTTGSLF